MRRLEVDLAAAEEDAVVPVAVLVLADRPHPQPLPATQLAPPHVLRGLAWTHSHLELHLSHVLEGFIRLYGVNIHVVPNLPLTPKQRLRFSTWASY